MSVATRCRQQRTRPAYSPAADRTECPSRCSEPPEAAPREVCGCWPCHLHCHRTARRHLCCQSPLLRRWLLMPAGRPSNARAPSSQPPRAPARAPARDFEPPGSADGTRQQHSPPLAAPPAWWRGREQSGCSAAISASHTCSTAIPLPDHLTAPLKVANLQLHQEKAVRVWHSVVWSLASARRAPAPATSRRECTVLGPG